MSRSTIRVLEEQEKQQIIRNLLQRQRSALNPERTKFQISRAKNTGTSPTTSRNAAQNNDESEFAACYAAYQDTLRTMGVIDLDDMISRPLELLRNAPARVKSYGQRWRYILADEYQDTNRVQYDLMHTILGPHQNICVTAVRT